MKRRNKCKRRNTQYSLILATCLLVLIVVGIFVFAIVLRNSILSTPPELLIRYMEHITKAEYKEMYSMVDSESKRKISRADFIKRNSAIYEGIEIHNLDVEVLEYDNRNLAVSYAVSFDTIAGNISFDNIAFFYKKWGSYFLIWDDSLIFPELNRTDKVRISTVDAKRGEIMDRYGRRLAGNGTASSVGVVPGRLIDQNSSIRKIAALLDMKPETIERKISEEWVKDDYFVPIKTVPKVRETDLMSYFPDEAVIKEKECQDSLLAIPGVMISDISVREYPLKDAAAHLIGYVQSVTEDDLQAHVGEGYNENSVIGRSGMEGLFEKELKGQNGYDIYIVDELGQRKTTVAFSTVRDGEDIRLTIDSDLQRILYEQYKDDKSCSLAMNPYTGEVLAMVSTPSYDTNAFIFGMSEKDWLALNEDARMPLYNRFRQIWCPGSSFKPVIAEIGLETGAINPFEDYGYEGFSWQKDSSWGSYYVTTLHDYSPVILENALIYSDNIYFAKAALKIGADNLESFLERLGFGEQIPFEIAMTASQYSNAEHINSEIQLADSGYGQGQILINPLHLACIYTSLCNSGSIVKPRLRYQESNEPEVWIPGVFSSDVSARVLDGTKKVVNDPNGTGYSAARVDMVLAGKTGTAEIKESTDDQSGTELGWFVLFTTDKFYEKPILFLTMVEDVKNRGGSSYVVDKESRVMDWWLDREALP